MKCPAVDMRSLDDVNRVVDELVNTVTLFTCQTQCGSALGLYRFKTLLVALHGDNSSVITLCLLRLLPIMSLT